MSLLSLAAGGLAAYRPAYSPALRPSRHAPAAMALPANEKCSFVLLAGGSGSRMKADRPKQFLNLLGRPVLQWDLELLLGIEGLDRIVLVIAEEYRSLDFLQPALKDSRLVFANPGEERQNSVENGLSQVGDDCTLVAIHDAARPLVTIDAIDRCFADAAVHDAAVLAVPCKPTIKESNDGEFVLKTLDRSKLWDVQTPQILRPQKLRDGFKNANEKSLAVTDDVSVVELMGNPVKLTVGEYTNLKLTTPEDMIIAETILRDRGERHRLRDRLKNFIRPDPFAK
jgi:2-C-methyl-D-erythritol 4-phosphate cytidylyltransferase